jgi:antitoxin component YwqK of YwqJK toxin-antitoxin module
MKLILALFLALVSLDTLACSCGGFKKVSAQDILYYDLILEGRVISVTEINSEDFYPAEKRVLVKILNQYFGNYKSDTITITTGVGGGDCGLSFKSNEKWLIFANSNNDENYASLCSKSIKRNFSNSIKYRNRKNYVNRYSHKTKHVKDKIQSYTIEGSLESGKPEGYWYRFNKKDTIEVIEFNKGVLNGAWIKYHERGNSKTIRHYKNGNANGYYEYYDDSGNLQTRTLYQDGLKHGSSVNYHDSGSVSRIGNYLEGKEVGEWKVYYESGTLKHLFYYNNQGEPIGTWKDFDEQGNLIESRNKEKAGNKTYE